MKTTYYDRYTLALGRHIHIPYVLVASKELKELSTEAKILYAYLFDWQCNYSKECELVDENGHPFVRLQEGLVPHFEWNHQNNPELIEELQAYNLVIVEQERIYVRRYTPERDQIGL